MELEYRCTECNKLIADEKDGKIEVQCSRCKTKFIINQETRRLVRTVRGKLSPKGATNQHQAQIAYVEIFASNDHTELELQINHWLKNRKPSKIIGVYSLGDGVEFALNVMIMYERQD